MSDCCTTSVYYEPPPAYPVEPEVAISWCYLFLILALLYILYLWIRPPQTKPDKKKLDSDIKAVFDDLTAQADRFIRPEAKAALIEARDRVNAVLRKHELNPPIE